MDENWKYPNLKVGGWKQVSKEGLWPLGCDIKQGSHHLYVIVLKGLDSAPFLGGTGFGAPAREQPASPHQVFFFVEDKIGQITKSSETRWFAPIHKPSQEQNQPRAQVCQVPVLFTSLHRPSYATYNHME